MSMQESLKPILLHGYVACHTFLACCVQVVSYDLTFGVLLLADQCSRICIKNTYLRMKVQLQFRTTGTH